MNGLPPAGGTIHQVFQGGECSLFMIGQPLTLPGFRHHVTSWFFRDHRERTGFSRGNGAFLLSASPRGIPFPPWSGVHLRRAPHPHSCGPCGRSGALFADLPREEGLCHGDGEEASPYPRQNWKRRPGKRWGRKWRNPSVPSSSFRKGFWPRRERFPPELLSSLRRDTRLFTARTVSRFQEGMCCSLGKLQESP